MSKTLDVYLHAIRVGRLLQNTQGAMVFSYDEKWLTHPEAISLSQSLPLSSKRYTRRECKGYFGGILPEARQRVILAKNLGISANNDFAMLELIGGECAGAVTFLPAGQDYKEGTPRYRVLSARELAEIIRILPRRPLLAGENGVRLSLAGAQNKLSVLVDGPLISLPLDGAPGTHILKPAIEGYDGVVFNEAFCMRLAKRIGLHVAPVEVRQVEGLDYLLVERYDRQWITDASGARTLKRVHQEDFCQTMGIDSEHKYQNEGGPSLKQCFSRLRDLSTLPVVDIARLLDGCIFNHLVGNNDAHGKNYSLLYSGTERRLAPMYDVLCTARYPELSPKMAMKLGGEYFSEKIGLRHYTRLAEELGMSKSMVLQRLEAIVDQVIIELKSMDNDPYRIADRISQRCLRLLEK